MAIADWNGASQGCDVARSQQLQDLDDRLDMLFRLTRSVVEILQLVKHILSHMMIELLRISPRATIESRSCVAGGSNGIT